ncbi:male-specific histamine-binding salivary protein-like [Ornithodoros turicata]|uniref:male-specific histamine-binding salivary protein-like n=1 Tax=Ornithodoros turicata TaxID=34597 RepID=UPI003138E216
MSSQVLLLFAAQLCLGTAQVLLASKNSLPYTPLAKVEVKNYAETLPRLGKSQDAWKFITANKTLHLYMRSFEHDLMYGNDSKCVKGNLLDANNNVATVDLSYIDRSKKDHIDVHFVAYFRVNRTEGYNQSNILVGSYDKEGEGYPYPMVFSDYKTCGIVRIPHYEKDGKPACQLWVMGDYVKKVNRCCLFIYQLLCGPEKHLVYDADKCRYEEQHDVEVEE